MPKNDPLKNLPDGVTLELLDEYARQKENERRRAYYANHPERVEQHRITAYTNFLNRHDKLVIPMPPAPPWTDLQEKCFMQMIQAAMRDQGGM